mmetsp:Transcript_14218/g.21927  ORF Transcript_14218/g.21927 Transcript_14218/m.21927 type:complete len:134 (-) Transcript_14218:32-433(-)
MVTQRKLIDYTKERGVGPITRVQTSQNEKKINRIHEINKSTSEYQLFQTCQSTNKPEEEDRIEFLLKIPIGPRNKMSRTRSLDQVINLEELKRRSRNSSVRRYSRGDDGTNYRREDQRSHSFCAERPKWSPAA